MSGIVKLVTAAKSSVSTRQMPKVSAHDAAFALLATSLVVVVLFWRLGTPTFWDPDEAHYAETTREMIATSDWAAPFYNEQPFFDKPVLFHQLQGTAMRLFADPEFGARLVPAVAALLLIAITVWFGSVTISRDVGLVAGLLLAACPGVLGLARYAILDTLFTMFMFGGAACLAVAALADRPRLQWLGYAGIAFGVQTKGPIALVLCGLAMLVLIALSADLRRRLLALRWAVGLVIIAALSAPWFVYMYLRFNDGFVNGYVLDENIRLFAGGRFANQPGFSFYLQILAAALLPWTGLLIGRLIDDVRALIHGERIDNVEVVLWGWTLAIVGFFTLSTFKLDHYVFPAAPALSLLCALAWAEVRAHTLSRLSAGVRFGFQTVGPILVIIGAGGGYFMIARLELPTAAIIVPVVMLAAGAIVTARANLGNWPAPRVPWIALAACTVTYAGVILWVLPALEQHKVVPDVARWVAQHAPATDRIGLYRLNRWSNAFRFYVDRHATHIESAAEAKTFFEQPYSFYCVMLGPVYDEFVAQGLPLEVVYERDGMWATSGRALWRRRIPPTRFVVVSRKIDP
jgi:4-amino-4-deoxy-L-arabinose transferase-like glycosyltransferase